MASKKTQSVKKVAPKAKAPAKVKAAPKAKVAQAKVGPRHPRARVAELHGSKAVLAKAIAPVIARANEDAGAVESRLAESVARLERLRDDTAAAISRLKGSKDDLTKRV